MRKLFRVYFKPLDENEVVFVNVVAGDALTALEATFKECGIDSRKLLRFGVDGETNDTIVVD